MIPSEQIHINFSDGGVDVESASVLPAIGCGAQCLFIGRTRPQLHVEHGSLLALEYDCYQDMAEQELRILAEEAIQRFSIQVVNLTHSIGQVTINEASVVIAVGSNHREEAFLACKWMIDLLKQRIPLWKKEVWANGTTWSEGKPLISHE